MHGSRCVPQVFQNTTNTTRASVLNREQRKSERFVSKHLKHKDWGLLQFIYYTGYTLLSVRDGLCCDNGSFDVKHVGSCPNACVHCHVCSKYPSFVIWTLIKTKCGQTPVIMTNGVTILQAGLPIMRYFHC